jgi:hypothetical protein
MTNNERDQFDMLLGLKRQGDEASAMGRFPKLDKFIATSLQPGSWAEATAKKAAADKPDLEALQTLFNDAVKAYQ